MIKTLHEMTIHPGQIVLLRLDLNVPVTDGGTVADTTRIERVSDTVAWLRDKGAKTLILSHFGRPKGKTDPQYSLDFLSPTLAQIWGMPVGFLREAIGPDVITHTQQMAPGDVTLLENIRFYEGEEANEPDFARGISMSADFYVNDAFSAAHRAHASTAGLPQYLPSYAGFQLMREVRALEQALSTPTPPLCAIVGGAKISTKLTLLSNLVKKTDHLILGGGMANTFLAAQGHNMQSSLVEPDMLDEARSIMQAAQDNQCQLHLPEDAVCALRLEAGIETLTCDIESIPDDHMMLDCGPKSIETLKTVIDGCRTLIWNGPVGAFEFPPFEAGTFALASHIGMRTSSENLISIGGGGDTVSALRACGLADRLTYLSTAGGAFLEWMEGKTLPGLAALG